MRVNKLSRWRKLAKQGTKIQGRKRSLLTKKPPLRNKQRIDTRLQRSIKLLMRGKKAKGLRILNRLAGIASDPVKLAKIQGALAQFAFKNGDFSQAAEQFATISQSVSSHPRHWFAGVVGQVRALLKNADIEEALTLSRQAVIKSESLHSAFLNSANSSSSNFRVGMRPHRPSVIASRLSQLFLLEGETECAQELFQHAVLVNPNGASRARHGLAVIALAKGDFAESEHRCREALLLGKFQKKTLSVWRTLIEARLRAGKSGLDAELIAGWKNTKEKTVKARALLEIVRSLRSRHDSLWMQLANDWLATDGTSFPIESTELRKLFLATSKTGAIPIAGFQNPAAVLSSKPNLLVPNEYLAAAKETVRVSLLNGIIPDVSNLINQAKNSFKPSITGKIRHGLAMSLIQGKRLDLARPYLQQNLLNIPLTKAQRWRSAWLLAGSEAESGNYPAAITLYQTIYTNTNVPKKFALQARTHWLNCMVKSGNTGAVAQAIPELQTALASITDYATALNFGRQISLLPLRQTAFFTEVITKSEQLSLEAFAKAKHPSEAIQILLRLTRRDIYDYNRAEAVADFWRNLASDKKFWLWSLNSDWWEYLSLVFWGQNLAGRRAEASALAEQTMNDPATPPVGVSWMGSRYGEYLLQEKDKINAAIYFKITVEKAPSLRSSDRAYYWLMIREYKIGNIAKAKQYARTLQTLYKANPIMLEEKHHDCSAKLVLNNMIKTAGIYSIAMQEGQIRMFSINVNKW